MLFPPLSVSAVCFCRRDTLFLPFFDIFTLTLSHKGQDLQYQDGYKCFHLILALSGIQQRHINNANTNFLSPLSKFAIYSGFFKLKFQK